MLGLLAGGCTNPNELPEETPPTVSVEGEGIVTADGTGLEVVDLGSVSEAGEPEAGRDYEELYDTERFGKRDFVQVVLALRPDGGLLAGRGLRETDPDDPLVLDPDATIGVYSPDDGYVPFSGSRDFDELPDEALQATWGLASADYGVWVSTPSTDLYFDNWRVFGAGADGAVRLRGYSEEILDDLMPYAGRPNNPAIGDDHVWWETPYPRGEKDADGHYQEFTPWIVGRPKSGEGDLIELAEDAHAVSASGQRVVYSRSIAGGAADMPERTYQIFTVDGPGADEEVLLTGGMLSDTADLYAMSLHGDRLAWAVIDNQVGGEDEDITAGSLYVWQIGAETVAKLTLEGTVDQLTQSDDLIAWGNGSSADDAGQYVLDVRDNTVWNLATNEGFSIVSTAGGYVKWSVPADIIMNYTQVGRWIREPNG